jgi:sporulation protein YlmC with PRC-barrel domain
MKVLYTTGAILGLALLVGASSSSTDQPPVWLASDLVGMKVVSEQGESLGKIEDIVVHPGGETAYAVLSFGGWLGMGDKLFAMPWSVLRTVEPDMAAADSKRTLVLPMTKERLKAAPGFDKENWPVMAKADWAKDIDAFYVADLKGRGKKPVEAGMRTSVITWRVSELKGTDVKNPSGDTLGDVDEVAIDTNGRVSYAVLSVGGFLGIGDRLVAVPWDSLRFTLGGDDGDERLITLAATKEKLEKAPEFLDGEESRSEMCDPTWIGKVYAYYSCPVYWSAPKAPTKKDATPKN